MPREPPSLLPPPGWGVDYRLSAQFTARFRAWDQADAGSPAGWPESEEKP